MAVARRPSLFAALVVAAMVLLCAIGLFSVKYAEASQSCFQPCDVSFTAQFALTCIFVSVAGLLITIGIALALGMNWRRDGVPNIALARTIEDEEQHLQEYRLRRAQLDEWTSMAAARAAEKAAQEMAEQQAAAEAEAAFIAEASRWIEEEEETQESAEDEKRRVLAEHMAHLARVKPEAVAAVLRMWINQPVR